MTLQAEWVKTEKWHDALNNPECNTDSTDTIPVIQHTELFSFYVNFSSPSLPLSLLVFLVLKIISLKVHSEFHTLVKKQWTEILL